jgi:LacI family transcriptional regulator
MKPTIKMIASHSGVSRGTVDRVIHNRPNVNPTKRQKVLDILKELEYTPNTAARALALKVKNMKVAALIPYWPGSFNEDVIQGIEDARRELHNYQMDILLERYEPEDPQECIEKIDALLAQESHGLVICAKNIKPIQEKLLLVKEKGIPVVTLNSDIPECGRLCFVGQDSVQEGRIAADIMSKLLPQGGKTLIICGNLEVYGHLNRVKGFCDKFNELGIDREMYAVLESHNEYIITYQKVFERLQQDNSIKGIYMANESVPGCVEAIRRYGMSGKVRVVCHDVSKTTTAFLQDRLVDFVIEQDLYRQGFMPFKIIANLLLEDKKPEHDIDYSRIHIACFENIGSLRGAHTL